MFPNWSVCHNFSLSKTKKNVTIRLIITDATHNMFLIIVQVQKSNVCTVQTIKKRF